jgi:catechol 2,3-dioxygenase-like lactoylglutathione lyase family enzyme
MSETASRIGITGVGRVAVPVSDQDKAYRFYVDTLGFEVRADIPYGEGSEMRWLEVAAPGSPTPIAIVPPRPGGPVGVETNIILTTRDIDATHSALREAGVDVDDEVSRMGGPVPPMVWFRDQDSNTLLLVEDSGTAQ